MSNSHDDNSTVPSPDHQDIDWQAFRYISGEMAEHDANTFEQLLSVDQAAREAVARSVELLGRMSSVSLPGPTVNVQSARPSRHPKVFAAAVAVAALVVVCLSFFGFHQSTNEPGRTLIALWTEPRDPNLLNDDPDGEPEDDFVAMTGEEADELAIPGWLLAALEPSSDDTAEDD